MKVPNQPFPLELLLQQGYLVTLVRLGSPFYIVKETAEDECFAIYDSNPKKRHFALRTREYEPIYFSEISSYSQVSKSYVVKQTLLNGKQISHVLFENGYVGQRCFPFIGEETNGLRPIQNDEGRWFFWDFVNNCYHFSPPRVGYYLPTWEKLCDKFTEDAYSVQYSDGTKRLRTYCSLNHVTYKIDTFFSKIEELRKGLFLCSLANKDSFQLIIVRNGKPESIGFFDTPPTIEDEKDFLITKRAGHYCIYYHKKVYENVQWQSPKFIICDRFAFNKSDETGLWRVFSLDIGIEVCFDWQIKTVISKSEDIRITYESNGLSAIGSIVDVKQKLEDLIHPRNPILYQVPTPIIKKESTIELQEQLPNEEIQLQKTTQKPIEEKIEFPSTIKYFTSAQNIAARIKEGFLQITKNCNDLKLGYNICWIDYENQLVVITKYIRPNTFKVVYQIKYSGRKVHVSSTLTGKGFSVIDLIGITEETLLIALGISPRNSTISVVSDSQSEEEGMPSNDNNPDRSGQPSLPSKIVPKENILIRKAPKLFEGINGKTVSFSFRGEYYSIDVGQEWSLYDAFIFQSYLPGGIIAILVDENNLVAVNYTKEPANYEILGCGLFNAGDQVFGRSNANKQIRDNLKRIILFRKDTNGKVILWDEVRLKGYREATQTMKSKTRTVIIFKFESLIPKREWSIAD